MARINTKKLVAFRASSNRGRTDVWCFCYFDSMQESVFTFETPDFIDRLEDFHIETLHKKETEITVGVKDPLERILVVTSEGNYIVLEGGAKFEVPAEIAEQFRKLLS
jgi:hypothetical protein